MLKQLVPWLSVATLAALAAAISWWISYLVSGDKKKPQNQQVIGKAWMYLALLGMTLLVVTIVAILLEDFS